MAILKVPVNAQDHTLGSLHAPRVLVGYCDYQCPDCGDSYPLIKELIAKHEHSLLFVFRNFPKQEKHPMALPAALAAEAAARQSKFWEMHDIIYENQDELSIENLLVFATEIGLNIQQFAADWKSQELLTKIEKDFDGGLRSGVSETPTFFVNGHQFDEFDGSYESLSYAISM
ncbi:DsbA family protein [Chitinophaga silvatica]|uniref:DsbA family protein n=1 Tax=Chitinophaga silvatica TaxID=2282649 RepID=A0A3E1YIJ2_9BACT|nr:thioredoxin domain-containing protein [Chitinophaga silvatica]RFS27060.1 DsbA family protein [Chitinophaga silvatica]